jgi:hypothetical protein
LHACHLNSECARPDAELRSDHDPVSASSREPPELPLGCAQTVHARSVEVADAVLEGAFEQAPALGLRRDAEKVRAAKPESRCLDGGSRQD